MDSMEQPSPDQTQPETPLLEVSQPQKKKGISLSFILSILLIMVTVLALFFYWQNNQLRRQISDQQTQTVSSPSPTISPSNSPIATSHTTCPSGFKLTNTDYFSICVQTNMQESIQEIDSNRYPGYKDVLAKYTSDTEIINITSGFSGGWGGLFCASNEEVVVGGYTANRTVDKGSNEPSCTEHITGLWTLVNSDNEIYPFPYLIQYESLVEQPLNLDTYTTIEQSLIIK